MSNVNRRKAVAASIAAIGVTLLGREPSRAKSEEVVSCLYGNDKIEVTLGYTTYVRDTESSNTWKLIEGAPGLSGGNTVVGYQPWRLVDTRIDARPFQSIQPKSGWSWLNDLNEAINDPDVYAVEVYFY